MNSPAPERIGRFEVRERLGGGGMGDVFAVWDPVGRRAVAVKVLKENNPTALQYFKREFRAVARLVHPNLVQFYELRVDQGRYYYSMELIDGPNLYVHVNGSKRILRDPAQLMAPDRIARARSGFTQLLQALAFLHENGCIHRDIKPSNVLVDSDGRVRLLDFGIVKEVGIGGPEDSLSQVFGTAVYMSPEQSLGQRITEATDLYAAGIVLYELLCGVPPFSGDDREIIRQHHTRAPRPLEHDLPGVPSDLAGLAMTLLAKEPGERPGAREALEIIGTGHQASLDSDEVELVGRRDERKRLAMTLDAVHKGAGRIVLVTGPAGIGKSALLDTFTVEARLFAAHAFTGACIQHDHVPARGLDTLLERLVGAYRRQATEIVREMPTTQRAPFIKAFPILRDMVTDGHDDRLARPGARTADVTRAGQGLKVFLHALGHKRLLVCAIEDLHYADELTVQLIESLQQGGDLPPVLLFITASPELAPPNVRHCIELLQRHPCTVALELGPLGPAETLVLVREQLGAISEEAAARLHAETGGDPLFLVEMVRHLRQNPGAEHPSLDALLAHRVAALPPGAKRVAAAVSVSRSPVPMSVLEAATGLDADVLGEAVHALAGEGFVDTASDRHGDWVVRPLHPRLMAVAKSALGPRTYRAVHGALAQGHEGTRGSPRAILYHWREAETPRRAAQHALGAAQEADFNGEYDRAAELWRVVLTAPPAGVGAPEARANLIESLTRAGRYEEAAQAIDQLVQLAPDDPDAWRIRQCELFLMGGNLRMFGQRAQAVPLGSSRVRLADLLSPFDPFRADNLLGDADDDEGQLVRARLLADDNRSRSIARAARIVKQLAGRAASPDPVRRAALGITRAAIHRAEGRPRDAQLCLDYAIEPREHHGAPTDLGALRLQLARAELALERGHLATARSLARDLLDNARERHLPGFVAWSCVLQARLHVESAELHAADLRLDEAEELWPTDPPSMPTVHLALARARRLLYGGDPEGALNGLRTVQAQESLRPFLGRRATTLEATLIAARARALMAIRAWRDGHGVSTARGHLIEILKPLKRTLPAPGEWLDVLGSIADLVGGQPLKAAMRLANWVDGPGNPLVIACAAHVLAAARDAQRPGDGATDRKRAAALLRDAQAAHSPEATALGV